MTLCKMKNGAQCICQPDDGMECPHEDKACREAFETWAKKELPWLLEKRTTDRGRLLHLTAWEAWQAGRAAKPAVPATCEWDLTGDYDSLWESSCGEAWSFIDGGPTDNNMKFCHGCGKPLAEPAPPETAKEDAT